MPHLFDLPPRPALPIAGRDATYEVARIFCIGRNYAAHAAEMGNKADARADPFFFTKSLSALLETGGTLAYPPDTENLHHEMELVVALGAPLHRAAEAEAMRAVFGYAAGLDMTLRDVQDAAKAERKPWDRAKDFENSAVVAEIAPAETVGSIGPQEITLSVNGEQRQQGRISDMIHSLPRILSFMSARYRLGPGDLIFTGTPSGVGPVGPGDRLEGRIDGLAPVHLTIGPRA